MYLILSINLYRTYYLESFALPVYFSYAGLHCQEQSPYYNICFLYIALAFYPYANAMQIVSPLFHFFGINLAT